MSHQALFPIQSPSYRQDRVGWNDSWERQFAIAYGTDLEPTNKGAKRIDVVPQYMYDWLATSNEALVGIYEMKREICSLQVDLTKKVIKRYAERDMQNEWRRCTPEERQGFLLEGLVRTCDATSDFESRRGLCPETSLLRLNRDHGAGYLDLLREIIFPDADAVPETYRTIPCAAVDSMIGLSHDAVSSSKDHEGYKILQAMNRAARAYFLTLFSWYTLLAFYGEHEARSYSKIGHGNTKVSPSMAVKIGVDPQLAAKEKPHRVCSKCQLTARDAGVDTLRSCAKCRIVFYCGKACQKADWKDGHKTVCGDCTAFFASATATPTDTVKENSATPSLRHQLYLLNRDKDVDYFFVPPAPKADVGIRFWPPPAKDGFRHLWAKLINEKDILEKVQLVCIVFRMLDKLIVKHGLRLLVPREALKEQLNREFAINMDDVLDMHGLPH